MENQDEINEREWENLDNWTLPVGFYFSKKDKRVLVPKRARWMGWTFNLGNSAGAWWMIACFLLPIFLLSGTLLMIISSLP